MLYGNVFVCLVQLCLIWLYVMASETCGVILLEKYFTLESKPKDDPSKELSHLAAEIEK